MKVQTESLIIPDFPFRRKRRLIFVPYVPQALGGVFLAEFGDVGAGGTYDYGFPSSQLPGTTRARITYAQLSASGTSGEFDAEVVCDGVTINFAAALAVPAGVTNFNIPALPDQFVSFDVTFNLSSTADSFNIVLYGLWEP